MIRRHAFFGKILQSICRLANEASRATAELLQRVRHSYDRLKTDVTGGPAVEYALLLSLVAAVAGFGMVTLGDSLGSYYQQSGTDIQTPSAVPSQGGSTYLANGDSAGDEPPRCVEVDSECIAGR